MSAGNKFQVSLLSRCWKTVVMFFCMGPLNHKVGGQYGWKTAGWGSCTCVQCGQRCFFFADGSVRKHGNLSFTDIMPANASANA
eukprot:s4210_g5.t1